MQTGPKKILANAAYLYLSLLTSQGLRMVYMLLLAKLLGAELYGLFTYGQSWYLVFLPLTGLGLGAMLSREIGRDNTNTSDIVSLVASIRVIAVLFVAMASFLVGWFLAETEQLKWLIVIFSFALIGKAMVLWAGQMFQAFEETKHVFKLERVFKPAEISIGIILAIMTRDILVLALVHAIGQLLHGLAAYLVIKRQFLPVKFRWQPRRMIRIVISLSPLGAAVVAGQFLFHGPVVVVKEYVDTPEQLGSFSLCMQIFIVVLSAFASIKNAALPALSRSASKDKQDLKKFSRISIHIALLFGISISQIAITYGNSVLLFVFSEKFAEAGQHVGLILFALVPGIMINLLNSAQVSMGNNILVLVTNGLGAATLIIGTPFLFAWLGMQGAVLALIASFSVSAITGLILLLNAKIIVLKDALFGPALLLSVFAISNYFFMTSFWSIIISSTLTSLYVWRFGLIEDERTAILEKIQITKSS